EGEGERARSATGRGRRRRRRPYRELVIALPAVWARDQCHDTGAPRPRYQRAAVMQKKTARRWS
ncbi:unnamed protein product, partial [Urochloa humidicola]